MKASEWCQMSSSERSWTRSKVSPGSVCAAWHGRAKPSGLITMKRRPQPSMHDFGYSA